MLAEASRTSATSATSEQLMAACRSDGSARGPGTDTLRAAAAACAALDPFHALRDGTASSSSRAELAR
eukprot:2502619-Prymnesium_polylepis.1